MLFAVYGFSIRQVSLGALLLWVLMGTIVFSLSAFFAHLCYG